MYRINISAHQYQTVWTRVLVNNRVMLQQQQLVKYKYVMRARVFTGKWSKYRRLSTLEASTVPQEGLH